MKILLKRVNELALRGLGKTKTNPTVGSIIYDLLKNKIIGEGFHTQFGYPHAEVEALKKVEKDEISDQTLIAVSLEPCNHEGKTPPCTKLIIHRGIKQIIIDQIDPNVKMQGKSMAFLQSKGLKVHPVHASPLGEAVIRPFRIQQQLKRPYIMIKMAMSQDGYISKKGEATKISNPTVDRWVHRWRNEYDGILVGTNTLRIDNPQLTCRFGNTHHPIRIVLDPHGELSRTLNVFKPVGQVIVFTQTPREGNHSHLKYIAISDFSLPKIMNHLYELNIGSLMIEGGEKFVNSLLQLNLWDEIRGIVNTELILGNGVKAPNFSLCGRPNYVKKIGNNDIFMIKNNNSVKIPLSQSRL